MNEADGKKIKVMIVEDSDVVRELLVYLLGNDPDISVVGAISNGEEAIEAVNRLHPDVITMDVNMPKMNGLEATRTIMETHPTPIVVVSGSVTHNELSGTFDALEAGALAVVQKPKGLRSNDFSEIANQLTQTVKLMSEIKVVKRWKNNGLSGDIKQKVAIKPTIKEHIDIVAIGASTGGPVILKNILQLIKKNLCAPILVVQHITPGFTQGFADWLAQATGFPVHLAQDGLVPLIGHVYIAPDHHHMQLSHAGKIVLNNGISINGHRPSVSSLFRSIAENKGSRAIGVLLTGMGKDGADELKLMREKGAITIAQNKETSIVYGMPKEAIALNAASYVLSPEGIAKLVNELVI